MALISKPPKAHRAPSAREFAKLTKLAAIDAATAWVIRMVTKRAADTVNVAKVVQQKLSVWKWDDQNIYLLRDAMNNANFHGVRISINDFRQNGDMTIEKLIELVRSRMK
jgi:hypothetical protein